MTEWLAPPWPWYVAGPLIGLVVPLLLLLGGKVFGLSVNLRHLCAMAPVPHKPSFFRYDGAGFGFVLVLSEVVSWFRIQEMFRFQSFHLYGIIGSAWAVAAISLQVIKRMDIRTVHGEPIRLAPKVWGDSRIPGARYWIGGTCFGLGWALLGACPGPIFALLGRTGCTRRRSRN